ncbi:MAG: hypothetical protein Q8Q90_00855 [bacterium]|nr:hypothetical protein [bacterium]
MKIKEIILALAIVVVLNLFFNYGVFTFYKEPKLENFCSAELTQKVYTEKVSCEAAGGRWYESSQVNYNGQIVPVKPDPQVVGATSWCDSTDKCRKDYDTVRNVYNRNVFIVLIVLGLVSLGLGFLVISASAVANGFLGGGLLSLIVGTIRYWSDMNEYLRFIVLGIALAMLIWLGYKKIKSN